ncbi:interphotoreceptor matrix proteoglycan 2 isoform X2 [Stegostoma tigrinum]|uniref:interphotoreceptor matrix proteoglycan 2 isoform X2 n=1 Tax=Stegostoma tigrinum TaxID=3053191 RepID=UPI0028704622|nr:interphotoreceptor matrix proteoglycan 2 isoform X2 [Stegostoma tigrinum]
MLGYWWKVALYVVLFNYVILTNSVVLKTATDESRLHKGSRSLSPRNIQSSVTVSDKQTKDLIYRQKRSFLFPNGVKLCPEETISQAIGNYLKYYKLRVCQEAVWEAFKTFWDRLPARHEHEAWMNVCDQGFINIFDIGVNFSQSEEHQTLMKEKLSLQAETVSSSSNEDLCILETTTIMNATSTENSTHEAPDADEVSVDNTMIRAKESEITTSSDIEQGTKKLPNQVLEFVVQLVGENYTKELSDPATIDYQKLADDVNTKMENVFGKFPGYQTINILEFREYPNSDSSSVVVHYTVTFDGNTQALQNKTLNLVDVNRKNIEDDLSFEMEHQLTAAHTVIDFKSLVVESLHKGNLLGNASLTFNPETLQLLNEQSTSLALGGITSDLESQETEFTDKEDVSEDSMSSTEELLQSRSTVTHLQSDQTTGKRMSEAANTPVILSNQINPMEQQSVSHENVPTSTMNVPFALSITDLSPLIDIELKETSDLSMIQTTASDALFDSGTFSNYESGTGTEQEFFWSSATAVLHNKPDNGSLVSNSIQFTNTPIFDDITVDYLTNVPSVTIGDLTDELSEILVNTIISNEIDVPLLNETASHSDIGVEIKPHIAETVSEKAPVEQLPDNELELTIQTSEPTDVFNYYSNDSTLRAQPFAEHATTLESIEESFVVVLPVTELSTKGQAIMGAFVTEHLETKSSTRGIPATSFIEEQFTTGSFAKGHILTELDSAQQEMLESANTVHTVTKSLPTEDMVIEQPTVGQLTQDSIRQSSNTQQVMTESLTMAAISTMLQSITQSTSEMQPFVGTFSISQRSLDPSNGVQSNTELSNDLQPFPTTLASPDAEISNVIVAELNNSMLPNAATSTVIEPTAQSNIVVQGFGESISEHNVNKSSVTVQAYSKSSNRINSDDESIKRIHTTMFPEVQSASKTSTAVNVMTEYFPVGHHDSAVEEHNEIQPPQEVAKDKLEWSEVQDISTELDPSYILQHHEESDNEEMASIYLELPVAVPTTRATARESHRSQQALIVFFSLRVTNMIFSDDLFNKSSHEYKALEQQFLELLVPYLQSNLTDFKHLEILNFRNGSIIVNSRMKFAKPVPRNVTNAVYLILDDFCNTAYQTMNLAIDRFSLDVESGNGADPCKFQACNEYSECLVNHWTGESECVCNAGYTSVDDLPCQSICDVDTDFCLNDGKCDIIPGQGAICRCRVGENWWYRGEHCEEYVSETLVVAIAFASVAGFLLVASAVIFCIARTLRAQYAKGVPQESTEQSNSLESVENGTKYNPMYESDATTSYSHYNKRYPQLASYRSGSAEASANFSSDEIRHIYEHSELSKEEIQDRLRIIDLYAKDRQFADFMRQHQIGRDNTKTNPTN